MINLFQFASQDRSLDYLSQVFGRMGGVISNPNNPNWLGGSDITLLGTMFRTFNSILLAVGGLIVVYVTVVGIMNTAHEGRFMGKDWNNLWIPIRVVLGIALLVPTASGYSSIQIIMMWVIVQGIGAADTLWTTTLNYVNVMGSPYAQSPIPKVGVKNTLQGLFQGLSCEATTRIGAANPAGQGVPGGAYYCNPDSNPARNVSYCDSGSTFNANAGVYSLGPNRQCGTLRFCTTADSCTDPTSIKCKACQTQLAVLPSIISQLSNIAQQFAQADLTYRDFYYQSYDKTTQRDAWEGIYNYCSNLERPLGRDSCCNFNPIKMIFMAMTGSSTQNACRTTIFAELNPNARNNDSTNANRDAIYELYVPYIIQPRLEGNFVSAATNEYAQTFDEQILEIIKAESQKPLPPNSPLVDAQKDGWMFAGSYYYLVGKQNSSLLKDSMPQLEWSASTPTLFGGIGLYRNNYNAAKDVIMAAAGAAGRTSFSSVGPEFSGIGDAMSGGMEGMQDTFQNAVGADTGSNPLIQVQAAGVSFLVIVEVTYLVFLIVTFALGIAGNIHVFALGTGMADPVGPAALLLYFIFIPAVYGLLGIMLSLGGLLGIYTPLIPYIIFMTGALGWLISVVEAMVAGPLVALGVISPSGHHELLGKAEPALMLLFNIFLRPSLMIFGMMAAMLISSVAVSLINSTFWTAMKGIGTLDPLGMILFLCAYVMIIVAVLNKSFAAIHIIPERVMAWIGHQAHAEGAGEIMGEMKGGVQAGSSGATSAAGGLAKGGSQYKGHKAGDDAKAEAKAEADKNKNKGNKGE